MLGFRVPRIISVHFKVLKASQVEFNLLMMSLLNRNV